MVSNISRRGGGGAAAVGGGHEFVEVVPAYADAVDGLVYIRMADLTAWIKGSTVVEPVAAYIERSDDIPSAADATYLGVLASRTRPSHRRHNLPPLLLRHRRSRQSVTTPGTLPPTPPWRTTGPCGTSSATPQPRTEAGLPPIPL